jgi:hypothetical protein
LKYGAPDPDGEEDEEVRTSSSAMQQSYAGIVSCSMQPLQTGRVL